MKKLFIFILLGYSAFVMAEGKKVQENNIIFDEDGEPTGIVIPVDCTKTYSPQSGAAVYFCSPEE